MNLLFAGSGLKVSRCVTCYLTIEQARRLSSAQQSCRPALEHETAPIRRPLVMDDRSGKPLRTLRMRSELCAKGAMARCAVVDGIAGCSLELVPLSGTDEGRAARAPGTS
jgi:hypothetical protein